MSNGSAADGLHPSRVGSLISAVARLAAPAHVQVRYLRNFLPSIDELGLEFDDEFQSLDQFVQQGWLSSGLARLLERLDETIGEISDDEHEELWTQRSLESAPEWQLVRQAAWDVLTFSE